MMKPIFALIVLAGLSGVAPEAEAQFFRHRASSSAVAAPAPPAPAYRYSYYASSNPARGYVGYGADEFPFYGAPYGYPYDRWTWPYLSGSYGNGLARYYDPPVK